MNSGRYEFNKASPYLKNTLFKLLFHLKSLFASKACFKTHSSLKILLPCLEALFITTSLEALFISQSDSILLVLQIVCYSGYFRKFPIVNSSFILFSWKRAWVCCSFRPSNKLLIYFVELKTEALINKEK